MAKRSLGIKGVTLGIILLFVGTGIIPVSLSKTEKRYGASQGTWLYVGGSGPGNYTRIQDAIDNASDNDTIFVYSGMYNENIVINKSIALVGQERTTTVILGANGSVIINLQDCCVELQGFTIQKGNETNDVGISIGECWSSHIHGNSVISCGIGMLMIGTESTTISNNTILNCTEGLFIGQIANITITHNRIEGNRKGSGITLGGVLFGIQYKNYIIRNTIKNHSVGLYLFGAWSVVIQGNNFIGNQQHAFFVSSLFNKWNQNYWNQSSNLPKIIPGQIGGIFVKIKIPFINVDWHPAQEPYDL